MAAGVAVMFYFQRAYGFTSRGWGDAPGGSVAMTIMGIPLVGL